MKNLSSICECSDLSATSMPCLPGLGLSMFEYLIVIAIEPGDILPLLKQVFVNHLEYQLGIR